MTSTDPAARRFLISGRVQGVGFRYFTQQEAQGLEVAGWVRNLPDGNVEVHLEGAPERVEQMLTRLRRGPSFARVEGLEERPAQWQGCRHFSVRR